jgi:hypothetical protein
LEPFVIRRCAPTPASPRVAAPGRLGGVVERPPRALCAGASGSPAVGRGCARRDPVTRALGIDGTH